MADLPNEDREKRYVATGPNQGTSVRGVTGFFTDASLLSFGVNAQGTHCGVYGESVVNRPQRTPPPPASDNVNIGVCGVGLTYGVFGDGGTNAGVYGQHTETGAGVIGVGDKGSVTGVIGASKAPLSPAAQALADGIGVKGMSDGGQGAGVVGLSIKDFSSGDLPRPVGGKGDGTGIGVMGESGTGTGVLGGCEFGRGVVGSSTSGVGVEGICVSGSGVVGSSTSGVGAFFTSVSSDGVRGRAGSGVGVRGDAVDVKGVGVFGHSEKAAGVVGVSKSASQPGVFGFCDQLTGVAGRSTSAPGVFGESQKQAGVMGISTSSSGVFGFGKAPFQVPGPPAGVFGVNDESVGVLGSSVKVIGVWGNTDKGLGVIGTANFGAGAPTDQITDQGIGVIGLGNSGFGVAGMSTAGTGVFGSSKTGLAGHFKGPVTIEGDVTIIGIKSVAAPHPDGLHRQLYCMESPESWFEDFGEAQLVDGRGEVRLDPDFAALVEVNGYHVFLTPYGESRGMFVAERYASGFRVCEQQGGTSNVSFAYRVVAKRKDVAADRLATVRLPEVSSKLQLPDLRLKIGPPDFERLSVNPFDLPGSETGQ